jgi:hypothetical protein
MAYNADPETTDGPSQPKLLDLTPGELIALIQAENQQPASATSDGYRQERNTHLREQIARHQGQARAYAELMEPCTKMDRALLQLDIDILDILRQLTYADL